MLCFMLLVEIGLVIAKLSLAYVRATTQHVMGESIINVSLLSKSTANLMIIAIITLFSNAGSRHYRTCVLQYM